MIKKKGFTLIDVLVGAGLALIVFLGISGAYQLGIKIIGQSRNKIVATSIANEWLEKIRNLSYESVGVLGGFPEGVLDSATSTIINGTEYLIDSRVDFVVDQTDGLVSPDDECPNDYKRIKIKVSWAGRFAGDIALSTDISPKNLAQECSTQGGILGISVFDAYGNLIPFPLIEIKDPQTDEIIKIATPVTGEYNFSLATSTYKTVVSKSGYSSEKTFGSGEIYNGKTVVTPVKSHPLVLKNQLTGISFSIDGLGAFSVDTLSLWGQEFWADSFADQSKISDYFNLAIGEGEVKLASSTEGYFASGFLVSDSIAPANLANWGELSWTDLEYFDTDLEYQIYYSTNTSWLLIPDSDLTGNSGGFDDSPINLSDLSIAKYPQLKIKGNFSTNSTATTPILKDWQVSWITDNPTAIPYAAFSLRGNKIVGYDAGDEPIYKYSLTTNSDYNGHIDIPDLEWDSYAFSVNPAVGLDLVITDPQPQPISLSPSSDLAVKLYMRSDNSFLAVVQDAETLEPIFGSAVRLYNLGLGYNTTQYTNEDGQTYFIPLTAATYNLEVQASGYSNSSSAVSISGDVIKMIKIMEIE